MGWDMSGGNTTQHTTEHTTVDPEFTATKKKHTCQPQNMLRHVWSRFNKYHIHWKDG